MTSALIGHTGFVGSNFAAQRSFDALYNSKNIAEIAGRAFDLVVCAAAPGAKWVANQFPVRDRESVENLTRALQDVEARRFVLISTVDVFHLPVGVDENTEVVPDSTSPYGRHRCLLERFVQARFDEALVVRLPGLFGPGIKKNVIFDFLHENELERVSSESVFQFYGLSEIARDVDTCLAAGLRLVHFATEPVSVSEVARHAFGREFTNKLAGPAPRYDMRTLHAETFGRTGPYLASKQESLERIAAFVRGGRA